MKPITSTSTKFLKTSQLPKPLREAIKSHMPMALRDNLDLQEDAAGFCLEASIEFLDYLKAIKVKQGSLREYIFCAANAFERKKQARDKFLNTFPFDTDGCRFHFVVKVGEFIIDWTARQFGQENPFPAIWREP